jgi:hypothetical protein
VKYIGTFVRGKSAQFRCISVAAYCVSGFRVRNKYRDASK